MDRHGEAITLSLFFGTEDTMKIFLLVLAMTVDGVPLEPMTLMDPPTIATTPGGVKLAMLGQADGIRLALMMRDKGFTLDQIVAALTRVRVVESTRTGLKCGECYDGGMTKINPRCVEGGRGTPCSQCKVCTDPAPEPIAVVSP